jgi:hypothetical protein
MLSFSLSAFSLNILVISVCDVRAYVVDSVVARLLISFCVLHSQ